MPYVAPVSNIAFALETAIGPGADVFADLDPETRDAILSEAGRVATDVIAPLNRAGDRAGAHFGDGAVKTPPGWREAYTQWSAGGWNSLAASTAWDGQGLPRALNAACVEMWNGAAMAFGIAPILTMGAIDALTAHGSAHLKETYLPKLVSGAWTGTMMLTEPQAGSDVGALRTRAERAPDGSYRLFGQKIFITYGEHDLTDNIVHLVLARLPDAPAGTRGISLFLVPKFLVGPDGGLGERNDVRAVSIEHKLGLHGSPTCTMVLGDEGGATGFLVGEEHRGMACMFTMMNQARLMVGLQGVGIAEAATQQALAYARARLQGHSLGHAVALTTSRTGSQGLSSALISHPDVKRMLMTMRAMTRAARAICYATAVALDRAEREPDAARRQAAEGRAALLTPVAKAFATDAGTEVASLGVQVHGGMGYIEDTGAAQFYRDARIAQIYEGTNGIQAIDLVTRKIAAQGGAPMRAYLAELRGIATEVRGTNDPRFGTTADRLTEAIDALERATAWMTAEIAAAPARALAGATPYLRAFGLTAGGCLLAAEALAALRLSTGGDDGRPALARFFAENILCDVLSLTRAVMAGGDSVLDSDTVLLGC